MGVGSNQSRAAAMTMRVFDRAVHPDWFATRAHRRIVRDAWEADVRIIEAGHAIHWRCGPVRLTELLAGPEVELPDSGLLFRCPVRQNRPATLRPGDRAEFQACFEVERLDLEVFAHLCDELTSDPTPGDLLHRPCPAHRLAPSPLSRVHVEPRARGLTVHSFHTFPAERAIVRTQSLFEIRTPPAR